ncbi:hypothetical protein NQ154_02840 [Microbacterium sp. zg.B96]|nr:hypothetical protein [Microbacterium sp. zg.B96]
MVGVGVPHLRLRREFGGPAHVVVVHRPDQAVRVQAHPAACMSRIGTQILLSASAWENSP